MLKIGDWLFDVPTRRLTRGADERKLSPKAARVLQALAETPGQVWSRDALLERVWPAVVVGEEVLTHAVAEIRLALGDEYRRPRHVETVHKSGYRLLEAAPFGAGDFDLDVYARCIEARELYERGGRPNTASAIDTFLAALQAKGDFWLAHIGLAKALTFWGTYYAARATSFKAALEHCDAALCLKPDAAEAYAVQGFIAAIADAFADGETCFKKAFRADIGSGEAHYFFGRACLADGRYALAATMLERAAALRADDYHSLVMGGKARLKTGEAMRARADFVLALARIETRLAMQPDEFRALCGKAHCLMELGRAEEAFALMERIGGHPDPMNYYLASCYARANEEQRASEILGQVVEEGWGHAALLAHDPDFDAMRDDRAFRRIARSLGA